MNDFKLKLYLYLAALGCAWSFIWSQLLLPYGLFLLLLLGASWYLHPVIYRNYESSKNILNILIIIYLIFFIFHLSFYSHSFIKSVQHMILFILIIKLSTLYYVKDAYQITLINFIALINALSWNFESYMLYPFLFSFLFIILSLVQLSKYCFINRFEKIEVFGSASEYLNYSLLIMISSIILASMLFAFMPRAKLSYFNPLAMKQYQYIAGFSDVLRLGEAGSIAENRSIVFRAELNKKINREKLYWRGVALDYFDGYQWINSKRGYSIKRGDNLSHYQKEEKNLLIQKFYKLPSNNDYLFYLYPLEGLRAQENFYLFDDNENINSSSLIYEAYSKLTNDFKTELTEEQKRRYLQLPKVHWRIVKLSEKIIENSHEVNDKVDKIIRYLKNNYNYTKELERMQSQDPVYDFLFYFRRGNCEYFASALCLLLRLNSIPCRVVNGFLGGEYNILADYYIVRQSDAHSWVEAYVEREGWKILDATPETYEQISHNPLYSFFININDAINFAWENYVLLYSKSEQRLFISKIKKGFLKNLSSIFRLGEKIKGDVNLPIYYFLLILLIISIFIWFALFLKNMQSIRKDFLFYKIFLLKMRIFGYKKTPFMTPLEFVLRLKGSKYEKKAYELTLKYCQLRYGNNGQINSQYL